METIPPKGKRKANPLQDNQIYRPIKTEKLKKSSKECTSVKGIKMKRNNKGETQLHLAAIKVI